jgi:hypothetical protein
MALFLHGLATVPNNLWPTFLLLFNTLYFIEESQSDHLILLRMSLEVPPKSADSSCTFSFIVLHNAPVAHQIQLFKSCSGTS